jgi:hypothetical protein
MVSFLISSHHHHKGGVTSSVILSSYVMMTWLVHHLRRSDHGRNQFGSSSELGCIVPIWLSSKQHRSPGSRLTSYTDGVPVW